MALDPALEKSMLAMVPHLRAFAIALCRRRDLADDLVQETLVRALTHIHLFEPGTSLSAWLLTILRNQFRSECRKQRRSNQPAVLRTEILAHDALPSGGLTHPRSHYLASIARPVSDLKRKSPPAFASDPGNSRGRGLHTERPTARWASEHTRDARVSWPLQCCRR